MSANSCIGDFDLNIINLRKGLEFPDTTIQTTAYQGSSGIPTLEEVLIAGDDANGLDIVNVDNLTAKTAALTSTGLASLPTLNLKDTTSNNEMKFVLNADIGNYNDIVLAGNEVITAAPAETLTLCSNSATTNGVRIDPTSVLIGAGGNTSTPTSSISFSGTTASVTGNILYNNNSATAIPSAPSINATTVPSFEIQYFNLGGNAGSVTQAINLSHNVTNTTDYAVFPSVYYGFSGSGGTYTAVTSSSALSTIIISSITSSQFTFNLQKATGDNVNIFITFLIVYNVANTDYPKAY